jgi:hypothetical protein
MSITASNDRSNMEGRRPISLLTIGGEVGVNVCERCVRLGGARGPLGTEGGLEKLKGLEMFIVFIDGDDVCLDDIESNLPLFVEGEAKEPEEEDEMSMLVGLSFLDILVFRPNEAKNPPLFNEMDVDGVRERIEGEGPMLELDRDELVRGGFIDRDGYGRVRDTEVGVMSPSVP